MVATGKSIPAVSAFEKMLSDDEYFKILGYAYIIGLEGMAEKKEVEGGNKDEE